MGKEAEKLFGRRVPFNRYVRVGNFQMCRRSVPVGTGRSISAIEVTDMDGLWKLQIPSTWQLYALLTELYGTGVDADEDILQTYITTFYLSCCVADGYFRRGLLMLARAYAHPESLEDESFLSEVRVLSDQFKDFVAENRADGDLTDEEYNQAKTADAMRQSLSKKH